MPDSSTVGTGRVLLIVLVGGLLLGVLYETVTTDPSASGPRTSEPPAVPDSINALTTAEREAGWQLLFDGSSLTGWRGYQRDSVPPGWTVERGAIHFSGDAEHSTTLISSDRFAHFELRIEWKIAQNGNSGIMYRATESKKDAYRTGPEYQVLDNAVLDSIPGSPYQAGALYGLYVPTTDVTRPIGEYNETRIVVRGDHIEHWMNGTQLLEAAIGSDTWRSRVSGTKFAEYDQFTESIDGHIALQDHGHPVWYRDIKLRPLTPGS